MHTRTGLRQYMRGHACYRYAGRHRSTVPPALVEPPCGWNGRKSTDSSFIVRLQNHQKCAQAQKCSCPLQRAGRRLCNRCVHATTMMMMRLPLRMYACDEAGAVRQRVSEVAFGLHFGSLWAVNVTNSECYYDSSPNGQSKATPTMFPFSNVATGLGAVWVLSLIHI